MSLEYSLAPPLTKPPLFANIDPHHSSKERSMSMIHPRPFFVLNFCPNCGQDLRACSDAWPKKTCAGCQRVIYHPINSVSVLIIFVRDLGIVFIRRGIEPQKGGLALPGGYQEFGEDWREAAQREISEEAQIDVDPARIKIHAVVTVPAGHNVHFGVTHVEPDAVKPFVPSDEVLERKIVPHHGIHLCFDSHQAALTSAIRQYGEFGHPRICP